MSSAAEVIHILRNLPTDQCVAKTTIVDVIFPAGLERIAQAQDGIITRRQALTNGLSSDVIRHATRPGGPWQRVQRGVIATFSGALQARQTVRVALLLGGEAAMITGAFACRAYGMRYAPDGALVVLVPAQSRRVQLPDVRFQRARSLPQPRHVADIPCAPPERAVLDAVRTVGDLRTVRAALCEAVQLGLTTGDRLYAAAMQLRSATPLVRQALADVMAGSRSAPECELRDLVRTSLVVPEPAWNQPLPGVPALVPDAQWKQARLIAEIDSAEWHRLGGKPEETERRRARLAALGYRVLPISPRRIRTSPTAVLREIEDAYVVGLGQSDGTVEA